MYRIVTSGIAAKRLLYRAPCTGVQCAAFKLSPPTLQNPNYPPYERDPCPQPPPKKPPPVRDAWVWGTLTLAALSAAFAVYAKSNPEVRDWLSINAPWFDDFIAVLYQENLTYSQFAHQCVQNTKLALFNLFEEEPRKCTDDGVPIKMVEPPAENLAPECEDVKKDEDDEEECVKKKTPLLTKDICEVETCLKDLGDDAIFNYMTARDACIYYNNLVKDTMVHFSMKKLKHLEFATEERRALVKKHTQQAQCCIARLDELSRYYECGVEAPKEQVKNTKDLLKEYQSKIKTIQIEWQWANDKSLALDENWKMVEQLIDTYAAQNALMFKDLDYMSDTPSLKGDADLLLHHTLRYVQGQLRVTKMKKCYFVCYISPEQPIKVIEIERDEDFIAGMVPKLREYLKELVCDALEAMTERVTRGYEAMLLTDPKGNPVDERKKRELDKNLEYERKKRWAEIQNDINQRTSDKKNENYARDKEALKKHQEKGARVLEIRLQEKTIETNKKLDKMVAASVEQERKEMALEKKNMRAKLKLVEDKLEARLKAEREARRSQDLWVAGYSLLAATKKGEPYVRVDKEIKAIEKASGDGDKLVLSVLKAIPESVKKQGVVPESVIREKYHVMEDVAMKVALVEQEGAPLPVFILSFIQSLFLFMRISGIPQQEFDSPPKKPSEDLDTFDLLQRARFWIERGDIASALKYVGALQGASRAAAETWHEAARSHLETRQAAEAVLAHATALGLQYV